MFRRQYLNDGIKTTKWDSVKSTILVSTTYNKDFDGCVKLNKDFIKQSGEALPFHVAAVGTDGAGDDGGIQGKDVEVDHWYNKKEEFN